MHVTHTRVIKTVTHTHELTYTTRINRDVPHAFIVIITDRLY